MTQKQVDQLTRALRQQFKGRVEAEKIVGRSGRYRFAVKSEKFAAMTQLQRQDAVWKIADKVLPPEATLGISLILTFAPKDLVPSA